MPPLMHWVTPEDTMCLLSLLKRKILTLAWCGSLKNELPAQVTINKAIKSKLYDKPVQSVYITGVQSFFRRGTRSSPETIHSNSPTPTAFMRSPISILHRPSLFFFQGSPQVISIQGSPLVS
ncbi:hypothetical protein TNCV_106261 [Trichonephila clavipes]|nr:hypothetical protein TNCV_106261 [Trichonephila clavipes]